MTVARIYGQAAAIPSRTAYPQPGASYPEITHGAGVFLFGADGKDYLDASGGSGSLIFGHGDGAFAEVLRAQAERLTLFPSRSLGVGIVERYLAELVAFAPRGLDHALTFSSGSDAVEAAIKLAVSYHRARGRPGRGHVIGRRGSYHGNTLAGLAAGGFLARRSPYETHLSACAKGASAHCVRCEFDRLPGVCALDCAESLEAALRAEGPETVAAIILEPVVGAALSAAAPDPRYLPKVREICDRHGVLLIFDEVMTGFGRTGAAFAGDLWGVAPDILVCGKAMGGGYYPLSGVLATRAVAEVFGGPAGAFQNGHTHACSPLGAAVGLAVLARLREQSLIENAKALGLELRARLRAPNLAGVLSHVRGEGLMIGFDVTLTGAPPGDASDRLQRAALSRGLILYASRGGPHAETGDHAMLLPPLTMTRDEAALLVDRLAGAVRDLTAEVAS